MTHEALTAIEPKMQRAIEAMERDFAGIRTGRASTAWWSASWSTTTGPRRR